MRYRVLYTGLASTDDEGWIYAEHDSPAKDRGWIPIFPTPRRQQEVVVASFGILACDHVLTQAAIESDGKPTEADLKSAVLRMLGRHCHIIMDTRKFYDPHNKKGGACSGHHPEIMAGVCHHHCFRGWLQAMKEKIRLWQPTTYGEPLIIAVYCKRGRHRSVAAALLLQSILVSAEFYAVSAEHASMHYWSRSMCKGTCPSCSSIEQKTEVLENARRMWQSLPPH